MNRAAVFDVDEATLRSTRGAIRFPIFPERVMPDSSFSEHQLIAYLDEMLPVEQMTAFEDALRRSEEMRHRLAAVSRRRDQGLHSVGEIWRQGRLSCPTRHQLGGFLLGTLDQHHVDYLNFHIRTIGCRVCAANLVDLEQSMESQPEATQRRRKFFQTSAGYLPK